jgi:ubiquinone/menaquinone biosynthesis C-methylase UbiE
LPAGGAARPIKFLSAEVAAVSVRRLRHPVGARPVARHDRERYPEPVPALAMTSPRRKASRGAPSHLRRNRASWDRISDWYDRRHASTLSGSRAMAWGLWRIPESQGRWLGPVRGRRILELGCGAARWSIALRRRGGRAVGLDLSSRQLAKARSLARRGRVPLPLVRASAESIPFRGGVFDLVFCDWGAMTFADPHRTVPECARILRRGGRLVFAAASPFRFVAWDSKRDRQTRRLRRPYFGPSRLDFGDTVEFQLGYGQWVELFGRSGFVIERLSETQAPRDARTTYLSRGDSAWGRSWPLECLWSVRKR